MHAQATDAADRSAEVLLGADDRHLQFRSCVRVQVLDDGAAVIALGTRVRTLNAFGRLYMAAINRVHRRHVSPAMLRMAVAHALAPELATAISLQETVRTARMLSPRCTVRCPGKPAAARG